MRKVTKTGWCTSSHPKEEGNAANAEHAVCQKALDEKQQVGTFSVSCLYLVELKWVLCTQVMSSLLFFNKTPALCQWLTDKASYSCRNWTNGDILCARFMVTSVQYPDRFKQFKSGPIQGGETLQTEFCNTRD